MHQTYQKNSVQHCDKTPQNSVVKKYYLYSQMKDRQLHLDVIRGIAIFTMIFANSAPYFLEGPYPYWFRLIGTFAAPVFICITGFLLGKNQNGSNKKIIIRGLLTILVAVLIDLFTWKSMPFTSYDVLYLIGFGVCLFPLYSRLKKGLLLIMSVAMIVLPQLVFMNDYRSAMSEFKLVDTPISEIFNSLQALVLDGWFPLFPWLGLMMLATWTGRFHPEIHNKRNSNSIFGAVLIFLFGLIFMYYQQKITRNDYSELFYPPDLMYMTTAVALLYLLWNYKEKFNHKIFIPLSWLGRSSLFFYILHGAFIVYILPSIFPYLDKNYWILLLLFQVSIFIIAALMTLLKNRKFWNKMPMIMKFLFGN